MALISYPALLKALQQGQLGGAFFLAGDEEYLREQALGRVIDAHLDPATRDFNLDQLRGDDVSAESLASVLQTPPMMAEWRVVVVRHAQGLSQKARESLEAAVASPPGGLAIIVSATIPANSKARFYGILKKAARSVEFAAVDPLDAPGRLIEHASVVHGLELQAEAARALVTALGTEMRLLASELEKLAAYIGGRAEITLDDVQAVTGVIATCDRWAWFDLVGDRNLSEALRQLPTLLAAGESGVGLVIGLSAQLLRVGLACAGGPAALEGELKSYQRWLARRVVPQARRWTPAEVDAVLAELLRTDRLLKSASLSDRQAVEELLLRLAALDASGKRAA